jgi:Zn finger protein HypA/HybF involved in hydrogenase expression
MGKASRRKREALQALAGKDTQQLDMTCTTCGRETTNVEVSASGGCPSCGADNFRIGEPEFFGDWAKGL